MLINDDHLNAHKRDHGDAHKNAHNDDLNHDRNLILNPGGLNSG